MAESSGTRRAHRRHHSLPNCATSLIRSSSNFCCYYVGGPTGRRSGMSELGTACDYEDLHGTNSNYNTMASRSARFFTTNVREEDGDDDGDDLQLAEDVLSYKAPSRWKMFCRRVKAETRKLSRWGSSSSLSAPGFHYDAVSYAMNFDDGAAAFRQWQQPQELYMESATHMMTRLQSDRFSGMVGSDNWAAAAVSTHA